MNKLRRFSLICLIGYTALLAYWMLLGFGRRYTYATLRYNLKPFETIKHFMQVDRFNPDIWVINLLGNIGVFIPFGILIPLVFGGKLGRAFLIFFTGVFVLESLQLWTRRGSFDVDDLLLNSVGFLLGFVLYRAGTFIFGRLFHTRKLEERNFE